MVKARPAGKELPGLQEAGQIFGGDRNASCRGTFLKQPLPRCAPLRKFPVHCFQALYDHLMDFLADRGVDNTFADELIELSTALEHQEYIKFLEDLKSFVKCQ